MMSFSAAGKWWVGVLAMAMLVAALAGCRTNAAKSDKPIFMGLFGFNYTSRYIAYVTVDGSYLGGLDAHLNGGSSSMGRRKFKGEPVVIRVRWLETNQYDIENNRYVDDKYVVERSVDVRVSNFHLKDATTLVLHFLPDGTVEAELVVGMGAIWAARRMPVPKEHSYHVRGY